MLNGSGLLLVRHSKLTALNLMHGSLTCVGCSRIRRSHPIEPSDHSTTMCCPFRIPLLPSPAAVALSVLRGRYKASSGSATGLTSISHQELDNMTWKDNMG